MAEAAALIISILGAESTGKTTLAAALAARLSSQGVPRVAWVPELLREWCAAQGRTPRREEQAGILHAQNERIMAAAATHDVVICDTTGLMTAVYSRLIFNDPSLDTPAIAQHRGVALSLLTALDLPWVADGHQRDGPQVREPVDNTLRELLLAHDLPFAVVGGQAEQRVAQALAAVAPLLRARTAPKTGLFTRLENAADVAQRWHCECCVPECERALMHSLSAPAPPR
jgi:nicotinamide riboside kinase